MVRQRPVRRQRRAAFGKRFGRIGTYTLRLTVSDGEFTVNDEVQVTITVGNHPAPVVQITAPGVGASLELGRPVLVTASAAQSAGAIDRVEYFVDGAPIGSAGATPYRITWTPAATGSHTLTAVATDAIGATATSAPIALTITPAQPAVALSYPVA